MVIARWKDSLLERNLLGTSTNCRVSLPLLVDVEHDFVQVIPEWWMSVNRECEGDWSGALFLSTNPNVVTVFCLIVVNNESPLRRSVVLVWSETDS